MLGERRSHMLALKVVALGAFVALLTSQGCAKQPAQLAVSPPPPAAASPAPAPLCQDG